MQEGTFNFDTVDRRGKYNTGITLTAEDAKSHVKIYCSEPYAQDFYDTLAHFEKSEGIPNNVSKDLIEGRVYSVIASQISFDDEFIKTYEENSKTEIMVPFKEFSESIESLAHGENLHFKVMITKVNDSGQFIGSQKRCKSLIYTDELISHLNNKTWFPVKITKLIKGGYLALYKNDIECFIPGSHASANIIKDFSKLIGKELNVMVDNYDNSNKLFILSYKKYIKESMSTRITELEFGPKYTGVLTNSPYDFGIFVEIDGYFTGLVHSSEFDNYDNIRKLYKAEDEIDVYIKDVTFQKGSYRIVLTLDPDGINEERKNWSELKRQTEGKSFDYAIDMQNNSIAIYIDNEVFNVTFKRQDLKENMDKYPKVKVDKVDPVNKTLKFEFVEE